MTVFPGRVAHHDVESVGADAGACTWPSGIWEAAFTVDRRGEDVSAFEVVDCRRRSAMTSDMVDEMLACVVCIMAVLVVGRGRSFEFGGISMRNL